MVLTGKTFSPIIERYTRTVVTHGLGTFGTRKDCTIRIKPHSENLSYWLFTPSWVIRSDQFTLLLQCKFLCWSYWSHRRSEMVILTMDNETPLWDRCDGWLRYSDQDVPEVKCRQRDLRTRTNQVNSVLDHHKWPDDTDKLESQSLCFGFYFLQRGEVPVLSSTRVPRPVTIGTSWDNIKND